jgi:transposase-like protein
MSTHDTRQVQLTTAMPPTRPLRPQHEIDAAVRRYMQGESAASLARQYKISRAGMYLWIKKAREGAAQQARMREIGAEGISRETRINKDLRIRQLENENRELKQRLFDLMLKHRLL